MTRAGWLSLFVVVACGGSTSTDSRKGAPDASTSDAKTSEDCETLMERVRSALDLAQFCDPSLDEPSCDRVVEGPCCDQVVSPDNSAAIDDYLDALGQAKSAGCYQQQCALVDCGNLKTGDCKTLPVGTSGACEPVF